MRGRWKQRAKTLSARSNCIYLENTSMFNIPHTSARFIGLFAFAATVALAQTSGSSAMVASSRREHLCATSLESPGARGERAMRLMSG